jgi:hypothetical protein
VTGDFKAAVTTAVIVSVIILGGRLLTQLVLDSPIEISLEIVTFILLVGAFTVVKMKTRWLG